MMLVDTNVLLDVLEDDPAWADWSVRQLRAQAQVHELFINPVIYSELSLAFESVKAVDEAIDDMGLSFQELPRPALFLAGRAFVKYRRRGGMGAVLSCGILTRDGRRYRNYFPRVALVVPDAGHA